MKKFRITQEDYVKGMRKANREYEIETYGKPVYGRSHKHKLETDYNRQKYKRIDFDYA